MSKKKSLTSEERVAFERECHAVFLGERYHVVEL